ncbi:MAG: PAS domain-containing protein, partial [Pseudomonadota bacterium]
MAHEPDPMTRVSLAALVGRLLLASVACVGVLALVLAVGPAGGGDTASLPLDLTPRHLVVVAVIGGVFAFVAVAVGLLLRAVRDARRFEREAAGEVHHLRGDLAAAELVLRSEATLVISWDPTGGATLLAHALDGAPRELDQLMRFSLWLEPASAARLTAELDTMFRDGEAATFMVRTVDGVPIEAACRVHGGRAFLRLREAAGERLRYAELQRQFEMISTDSTRNRAVLDTLPYLVWFLDEAGKISWANAAYVAAVDAARLDEVLEGQLELLERRDRAALHAELTQRGGVDERAGSSDVTVRQRVHMIIDGERRAFDLVAVAQDGTTTLFASDVAALEAAEGELSRQSAANEGTLDRVSTAVAIFGADQRLTFHNEAYARLWALGASLLDEKPRDRELLDHLRHAGVLPDTGNFRKWRDRLLSTYRSRQPHEDFWHLPD